jgi:phosphonate transport system substrate-binding protein
MRHYSSVRLSVRHRGIGALPVLRFVTYLSPSLPLELFETMASHVGRQLGYGVTLRAETRVSGPIRGVEDPFSSGEPDVGFLCSPSYEWLRELAPPPAELLGVAPVFRDERNGGRPLYFCDVIVRRDTPVRSFMDLEGGSWAYNDRCSLSGYHGLSKKLTEIGADESFFGRLVHSGSHLRSIELVAGGEADSASIDSNAFAIRLRAVPELHGLLRVIESWGPFPVQPVLVRSALGADIKNALRASFMTMALDPHTRNALAEFGLERFEQVSHEHYTAERSTSAGA